MVVLIQVEQEMDMHTSTLKSLAIIIYRKRLTAFVFPPTLSSWNLMKGRGWQYLCGAANSKFHERLSPKDELKRLSGGQDDLAIDLGFSPDTKDLFDIAESLWLSLLIS